MLLPHTSSSSPMAFGLQCDTSDWMMCHVFLKELQCLIYLHYGYLNMPKVLSCVCLSEDTYTIRIVVFYEI